jgi:hypothetical protein
MNGRTMRITAITEGNGKARRVPPDDPGLPAFRLNLMRGGYLLMAAGLGRHALHHSLRCRHPGRDSLGLRVEALRKDSRGRLGTNSLMVLKFG